MNIQSLSVVVPTAKCINNCRFCVAHMMEENYKNQMDSNLPFYDLYERDYLKRLEFARDNGCNTVMLTGNGEPQQNRAFLAKFGTWNNMMSKPFRWVEMQTTGVLLDDGYLRFLRNHVGVSTISLSISSLDNDINAEYNGTPEHLKVDIKHLCHEIKRYDFNLRLSINLTDAQIDIACKSETEYTTFNEIFNGYQIDDFLKYCHDELCADQVTFRQLYSSGLGTPQDKWIESHGMKKSYCRIIDSFIHAKGEQLEQLPYGAYKYSINGMSVVMDDDCMGKQSKEGYKYLILRPNCKLYSRWDDPASLIF